MVSLKFGYEIRNKIWLNWVRSNRFHSIKYRVHLVTIPEHVSDQIESFHGPECGRLDKLDLNKSTRKVQASFACLRCVTCGHFVPAESPCGRLELLNLAYFRNLFTLYKYCKQKLTNNFSYIYSKI